VDDVPDERAEYGNGCDEPAEKHQAGTEQSLGWAHETEGRPTGKVRLGSVGPLDEAG
jgi:hypothetical protein